MTDLIVLYDSYVHLEFFEGYTFRNRLDRLSDLLQIWYLASRASADKTI